MKYHFLDKKAKLFFSIYFLIWLFILIIFFIFFKLFILNELLGKIINFVFLVLFLYLFLGIFIFSHIKYNNFKFSISKNFIEINKGVFILTKDIISTKYIKGVEVVRDFSLSKVVIYLENKMFEIPYLNNEKASKIALEIKENKKENKKNVYNDDIEIKSKAKMQDKKSFLIYFIDKVPFIFIISILCLWLKKYLLLLDLLILLISYMQYKRKKIWIEDEFIIVKKGILFPKVAYLNYGKIMKVKFKETSISRLYELKKINVLLIDDNGSYDFNLGYFSKRIENKIIKNFKKENV